jgi:hypothetical protein
MMSHPVLMAIATINVLVAVIARILSVPTLPWRPFALGAVVLIASLALERLIAGIRAARRFSDPTPLIFPVLHLTRDLAWAAAIGVWLARRVRGRRSNPSHSMRPRAIVAGVQGQRPWVSDSEPNRPLT